jgi:hypothetical protein
MNQAVIDDKSQGTLGLEKGCSNEKTGIPRLNQCYLCKEWHLEKELSLVEVPDQGNNYVQKLACKKCLGTILSAAEGIK